MSLATSPPVQDSAVATDTPRSRQFACKRSTSWLSGSPSNARSAAGCGILGPVDVEGDALTAERTDRPIRRPVEGDEHDVRTGGVDAGGLGSHKRHLVAVDEGARIHGRAISPILEPGIAALDLYRHVQALERDRDRARYRLRRNPLCCGADRGQLPTTRIKLGRELDGGVGGRPDRLGLRSGAGPE